MVHSYPCAHDPAGAIFNRIYKEVISPADSFSLHTAAVMALRR